MRMWRVAPAPPNAFGFYLQTRASVVQSASRRNAQPYQGRETKLSRSHNGECGREPSSAVTESLQCNWASKARFSKSKSENKATMLFAKTFFEAKSI